MDLGEIKHELRVIEELIAALNPDIGFAEDLVCLEKNRRALQDALSIERKRQRKPRPSRRLLYLVSNAKMAS